MKDLAKHAVTLDRSAVSMSSSQSVDQLKEVEVLGADGLRTGSGRSDNLVGCPHVTQRLVPLRSSPHVSGR